MSSLEAKITLIHISSLDPEQHCLTQVGTRHMDFGWPRICVTYLRMCTNTRQKQTQIVLGARGKHSLSLPFSPYTTHTYTQFGEKVMTWQVPLGASTRSNDLRTSLCSIVSSCYIGRPRERKTIFI